MAIATRRRLLDVQDMLGATPTVTDCTRIVTDLRRTVTLMSMLSESLALPRMMLYTSSSLLSAYWIQLSYVYIVSIIVHHYSIFDLVAIITRMFSFKNVSP